MRDPSLEVSIGGRQSQLQTGTYKRKLKDTGPLYSTHNCVGTSLRGGADQENTRCHFKYSFFSRSSIFKLQDVLTRGLGCRNVCLSLLAEVYSPDPSIRESSVNLTYYRPPSAKEAPYYWNSEFDAASWVKVGRSSDVFPNVVYEAIGEEKSWSEAETTVLTEAFWPENVRLPHIPPRIENLPEPRAPRADSQRSIHSLVMLLETISSQSFDWRNLFQCGTRLKFK